MIVFTTPVSAPVPIVLFFSAVFSLVLVRFGLLAVTTLVFASSLLDNTPLTTDFSRWYAWQSAASVLLLIALAGYAFWANLGGRPLWREEEELDPCAAAAAR